MEKLFKWSCLMPEKRLAGITLFTHFYTKILKIIYFRWGKMNPAFR